MVGWPVDRSLSERIYLMSCQELNLRANEIALLSMEYSAKRTSVKE